MHIDRCCLQRPRLLWRSPGRSERRHSRRSLRLHRGKRAGRPSMKRPSSRNMRRAPRSTSSSAFPASRSTSVRRSRNRATSTCAALRAPPAMSSSTASRPSTKAETLDVTLARIPAQQVIRVELGPGDLFGSDYAGKSQVLNVILSSRPASTRNVTASASAWFTGLHATPTFRHRRSSAAALDLQLLSRYRPQPAI